MNATSDRHDATGPQGAALRDAKRALRATRAGRARRVARRTSGRPLPLPSSRACSRGPDFLAAQCSAGDAPLSQRMGHHARSCAPPWTQARPSPLRASTSDARMLELHEITDLARDVGLGYRGIPEPLVRLPADCPRRDRLRRRAPASRSTAKGDGSATAAVTTIVCCRSFRLAPRASRAPSTLQLVDRVPGGPERHRHRRRGHRVSRAVDVAMRGSGASGPDGRRAARRRRDGRRSALDHARDPDLHRRSPPRRPRCWLRKSGAISASRPSLVGVFVGVVYAGSMAASLASGMFIERHGPIRVSQVCVLLCAAGALLVAAGSTLPGGRGARARRRAASSSASATARSRRRRRRFSPGPRIRHGWR